MNSFVLGASSGQVYGANNQRMGRLQQKRHRQVSKQAFDFSDSQTSNIIYIVGGVMYLGLSSTYIFRVVQRRKDWATQERIRYSDPLDISDADISNLAPTSAKESLAIAFKDAKWYHAVINASQLFVIAFMVFYIAYIINDKYEVPVDDMYYMKQGKNLFSSISLTVFITCGYISLLVGGGLLFLGYRMFRNPDLLLDPNLLDFTKATEKAKVAKQQEPYYWVKSSNPESVDREFERLRRKQARAEKRIREMQEKMNKM